MPFSTNAEKSVALAQPRSNFHNPNARVACALRCCLLSTTCTQLCAAASMIFSHLSNQFPRLATRAASMLKSTRTAQFGRAERPSILGRHRLAPICARHRSVGGIQFLHNNYPNFEQQAAGAGICNDKLKINKAFARGQIGELQGGTGEKGWDPSADAGSCRSAQGSKWNACFART